MTRILIIAVLLCCSLACAHAPISGKPSTVTLRSITSAIWCQPCHEKLNALLRSGHPLFIYPISSSNGVTSYPTFEYSDGLRDDGARVDLGFVKVVGPVTVYEVTK